MRTKVLLYSNETDPVSQLLIEKSQGTEGIVAIHLNEIIHHNTLHHQKGHPRPQLQPQEDASGEGKITWDIEGKIRLESDKEYQLINRILDIPWTLLQSYPEEDRTYIYKEIYSYLSWALPQFHESSSRPDVFGLGCSHHPLHFQWAQVEKMNLGLQVPHYFYGFREDNPFNYKDNIDSLVFSEPSKIYDWKGKAQDTEKSLVDSKEKNVFCFVKPKGIPYQVFLSYENGVVSPLRPPSQSNSFTSPHDLKKQNRLEAILLEKSFKIAKNFHHKIAELLFFVEEEGEVGNEIVFGMISSTLKGYKTIPHFSETLWEGIGQLC